jgi:hypothetical protein
MPVFLFSILICLFAAMQLPVEKLSADNLTKKDNSRLIGKVVTRENSTPEFEIFFAREGRHQLLQTCSSLTFGE